MPHRKKNLPFGPTPGFEHVNRFWDKRRNIVMAKILPGEFYVTKQDEAIGTVLGSCVAACVRDPVAGCGGMNHFMLPHTDDSPHEMLSSAFRYGNYAMEHLVNELLKMGARRGRLEFKLFGGGRIVNGLSDVGQRNIDFVRKYMELEGYRIAVEDLGGDHPRKIIYFPLTGKVLLKRLETLHNTTILSRETQYQGTLDTTPVSGEVDLF
ncbi:MAG: chemoreceptor glutamine deamidase CheD [Gammaproteobacteria bacterium]|nr:MAG: chemoreceptor glutamine deamidase CheD [Gammaproteobacteria bacterium]